MSLRSYTNDLPDRLVDEHPDVVGVATLHALVGRFLDGPLLSAEREDEDREGECNDHRLGHRVDDDEVGTVNLAEVLAPVLAAPLPRKRSPTAILVTGAGEVANLVYVAFK